jgi:hypothetical protein
MTHAKQNAKAHRRPHSNTRQVHPSTTFSHLHAFLYLCLPSNYLVLAISIIIPATLLTSSLRQRPYVVKCGFPDCPHARANLLGLAVHRRTAHPGWVPPRSVAPRRTNTSPASFVAQAQRRYRAILPSNVGVRDMDGGVSGETRRDDDVMDMDRRFWNVVMGPSKFL